MHVRVGNFRSYGADEPPEREGQRGDGIEILGDEDELVVLVIAQPEDDGRMVQLDRYDEAGGFDVVDQGAIAWCVMCRGPPPGAGPDNVRSFRRRAA